MSLFTRILLGILLATLLLRSADSAYSHFDMRGAEVTVRTSRLSIDHNPATGEPPYEFAIDLELETTDPSHRRINEKLELPNVGCPEEAYDELAHWTPGTRHKIYFIRGDAADVRLSPQSDSSPELTAAILYLIPAAFIGLLWFALQGAAGKLGSYAFPLVFFVMGSPMMLGALGIVGKSAWKRFVWQEVEVKVVAQNHQWSAALAPAGTKIHPTALQKISERGPYRLAQFLLGNRVLHLGLTTDGSDSSYKLWVNPNNRFDFTWDPWSDISRPAVLVLGVIGLAFWTLGYVFFKAGSAKVATQSAAAA